MYVAPIPDNTVCKVSYGSDPPWMTCCSAPRYVIAMAMPTEGWQKLQKVPERRALGAKEPAADPEAQIMTWVLVGELYRVMHYGN